jgi:hypothetical protein
MIIEATQINVEDNEDVIIIPIDKKSHEFVLDT